MQRSKAPPGDAELRGDDGGGEEGAEGPDIGHADREPAQEWIRGEGLVRRLAWKQRGILKQKSEAQKKLVKH